MELEYIFVYGSLRKVAATPMRAVMTQYCEFVADAWMRGRLYEINGYPGAIAAADANARVYGELYKIRSPAVVIGKLDEYEECTSAFMEPHEYVRKILPVMVSGAGVVMAWAYIFNHATAGLLQITSGDYPEFINREPLSVVRTII